MEKYYICVFWSLSLNISGYVTGKLFFRSVILRSQETTRSRKQSLPWNPRACGLHSVQWSVAWCQWWWQWSWQWPFHFKYTSVHNQSVPFISTLNISLPSDYHVWPRGYSTKFYMGRFCARSNFCFHIPLLAQNCISSIGKWHPFQIPSLELCITFSCCKCTVFKLWINHKTG